MLSITAFPPLFGTRRKLTLPPLEVVDITAADGVALRLHRAPGGTRGAVLLIPGTAMTGLSLCMDTVPENLTEHLHAQGFEVWLLDWRSSPYLPAHAHPYTMDDVARYDVPAAVSAVRARTGHARISVLGHCLGAPAIFLALLRGYLQATELDAIVASQVAFDVILHLVGKLKAMGHIDLLLPEHQMIHMKPDAVTLHFADAAISGMAAVLPQSCDNPSCHRQNATFGGLVWHPQLNEETHALMGELVSEVRASFLRDITPMARETSMLTDDDERHMSRLALPITLLSGEHNQVFEPASTEKSFAKLCAANDGALYRRHVVAGYGHLDCMIGARASEDVFPIIASSLGPEVRAQRAATAQAPGGCQSDEV